MTTTTERITGPIESTEQTTSGNEIVKFAFSRDEFDAHLAETREEHPDAEVGQKIEFTVAFVVKEGVDVPSELLDFFAGLFKEAVTPALYVAGGYFGDDLRTDIAPSFEVGHYAMIFQTSPIESGTN